jgi:hypothetical protein
MTNADNCITNRKLVCVCHVIAWILFTNSYIHQLEIICWYFIPHLKCCYWKWTLTVYICSVCGIMRGCHGVDSAEHCLRIESNDFVGNKVRVPLWKGNFFISWIITIHRGRHSGLEYTGLGSDPNLMTNNLVFVSCSALALEMPCYCLLLYKVY